MTREHEGNLRSNPNDLTEKTKTLLEQFFPNLQGGSGYLSFFPIQELWGGKNPRIGINEIIQTRGAVINLQLDADVFELNDSERKNLQKILANLRSLTQPTVSQPHLPHLGF